MMALMQCQAQIVAPSPLLRGSLGIHKITVASEHGQPCCEVGWGLLRVPIGRPFLRQPAIVE